MKYFILLLLGYFVLPNPAIAQIRVLGSFRVHVIPQKGLVKDREIFAANEAKIEAVLEQAIYQGQLQNNINEWKTLRQEAWIKGWRAGSAKMDTSAFHSLRINGYYKGAFDRKRYLIYLEDVAAFYLITIVNPGFKGAALGIETIQPIVSTGSLHELSKEEVKRYLVRLRVELFDKKVLVNSSNGEVY